MFALTIWLPAEWTFWIRWYHLRWACIRSTSASLKIVWANIPLIYNKFWSEMVPWLFGWEFSIFHFTLLVVCSRLSLVDLGALDDLWVSLLKGLMLLDIWAITNEDPFSALHYTHWLPLRARICLVSNWESLVFILQACKGTFEMIECIGVWDWTAEVCKTILNRITKADLSYLQVGSHVRNIFVAMLRWWQLSVKP